MPSIVHEMKKPSEPVVLKATLSLFDATAVGVGAIIGAGIFVVTGIVAGLAGSALIISVLLAAIVSLFTALSTAELAAKMPEEGGIYEYAHEMLSPFTGFLTGWMWTLSNIFAGAAVSLGFGSYVRAVVPSLPAKLVAPSLCLILTILNTFGSKDSTFVNNILVIIKLLVLAFFVIFGLSYVSVTNLKPFNPISGGVISGAYYIFFAFGGFARVAVIAQEVKDAHKTVPRAILLSVGISTVFYILVGFVAVGIAGAIVLKNSASPLADAMATTGDTFASRIISLGAVVATATVPLTSILGVSRMLYSMTKKGELPQILGDLHTKWHTPVFAIWLTGTVTALLAAFIDLTKVVAISTFALLFYYTMANLSAIKLDPKDRHYPRIFSILGVITCLSLLVFSVYETPIAFGVGGLGLVTGGIFYKIKRKYWKKSI